MIYFDDLSNKSSRGKLVHSEYSHFSLNAAKGLRLNLKWRLDLPFESATNTQFALDIHSHRVMLRMQQAENEN